MRNTAMQRQLVMVAHLHQENVSLNTFLEVDSADGGPSDKFYA